MPTSPDALPPELLNNDPEGYAWGVWHDRTPKLVRQIHDAHPYGPHQRAALDRLLEEIAAGPMAPLGEHAHDQELWARWGADHFGRPWLDAPFLWSEAYFFRRLLDAVGFFEPGPWHGIDPFEPLKTAELRDPALEPDLAALDDLQRLSVREQGQAKLLASLWGNRADLGFRIGASADMTGTAAGRLVSDDGELFWRPLGPASRVVIVADNAGRELLADLILIDHLLLHDQAESVVLHLKPHPYYVSDATTADLVACLRRLSETGGTAAQVARRLRGYLRTGRLRPYTHGFYCAPWCYRHLPADLAADLKGATLTVLKGDLNYRRLVGDRAWPPTTAFAPITAYFPSPVAALRTLKSDVLTGISPTTLAALDATGRSWRTDGDHGLLQVGTFTPPVD